MNRRTFLKTTPALIWAASGCRSRGGTSRNFPGYVNGQMHGELNESRRLIESRGVHRISPKSVKADVIPGHRLGTGGVWVWRATHPGFPGGSMWVRGLCYGPRIEVARNPSSEVNHQIHWPTVRHEFAHHWLMQNGHGPAHFPIYDGLFDQWAYARRVVGLSTDPQELTVQDLPYAKPGIVHLTVEVDGRPVAVSGWIPGPQDVEPLDIKPPIPIQFHPTDYLF